MRFFSSLLRSFSNATPRAGAQCVIPDCCNIGIVFRSLLVVNGVLWVAALVHANSWRAGALDFVAASMLIELATLLSLTLLCALRRGAAQLSAWLQRVLCIAMPALVTGGLIHLLASSEWFAFNFANLTVIDGMLLAGLFGGLLQHYFELRLRAFSPVLVEARLQALQARIQPHFLFNSLNAVLSLIRSEPQRAETALEDLADLFRVLMRDGRDMTTLEDEIRLCRQYLAIEKIRLGDRLQIHWEISNISRQFLQQAEVPSLLLQPLLENAVRYGIEPAIGPAPIRISLSRKIDRIEVIIVNRVHASAPVSGGNQMALQNIRERLALLYDVEAQFSATEAQGLFEVRLRFPYQRVPRPITQPVAQSVTKPVTKPNAQPERSS